MEYDWGAKVGYLSGDFILLLTHLVSHHWVLHIQDLLRNQVPGFKGPSFFSFCVGIYWEMGYHDRDNELVAYIYIYTLYIYRYKLYI